MDLKEFIKTVLIDIVEGVEQAKIETDGKAGHVCPSMSPAYAEKAKIQFNALNGYYYQQAEFDVAVTAENKTDGGVKAGVKVLGLMEAGMGGNVSSNNSTISRIKFHVPLGLAPKGYK